MLRTLIFVLVTSVQLGAASAAADKFNITAAEHAACDSDAERLCMSAYPDEDRLLDCMRANIHQLTPICLATFEAGMKRRHLSLSAR